MQFSHFFLFTPCVCCSFEQWLVWWFCCVHVWSFITLVVGILLFSPSTPLQSSFPSFWLVPFHLIFSALCAKSHGISFQFGQSVTSQFISRIASSSNETRDKEKLSASDPCPSSCPFLIWYLTVVCDTVNVSLAVWDSTTTNLNCHSYNSHATELVKFDDKYSCCLGMYCLKITKPCNFTVMLSTTKCFDGVLKFKTRS